MADIVSCIGENGITYSGKAAEKIRECWKAQDRAAYVAENIDIIQGFPFDWEDEQ